MVSRLLTSQLITATWPLWATMSPRLSHCGTGLTKKRRDLLSHSNSSILKSSKISIGLSSTLVTLRKSPQTVKKECCFSLGSLAYQHSNTTLLELRRKISVVKTSPRLILQRLFSSQTKKWPLLVLMLEIFWFGTALL